MMTWRTAVCEGYCASADGDSDDQCSRISRMTRPGRSAWRQEAIVFRVGVNGIVM